MSLGQTLLRSGVQMSSLSPGPDLDQEITETPQIKEKQSVKQEEEQLPVPVSECSAVCVTGEESSLLQERQIEHQTQGEDISSELHSHSETEGHTEDSSDTDNDDEWEPFSCPAARSTGLFPKCKSAPETSASVNDEELSGAEKKHQCLVCQKKCRKRHLETHYSLRSGERPYTNVMGSGGIHTAVGESGQSDHNMLSPAPHTCPEWSTDNSVADSGRERSRAMSDKNKSVESKIKDGIYRVQVNTSGKSDIWSRFQIVVDQDGRLLDYASCKNCKKILIYSVKTGTSSLRRHVCAVLPGQRQMAFSHTQTPSLLPLHMKQSITEKCVEMCCKDIRPLDMVAGKGFIEFVEHIVNIAVKYKKFDVRKVLPHPTTVWRHIESHVQAAQAKITAEIKSIIETSGCAITTDIWTKDYHKTSFISATVHYINDDFQLVSRVLFTAPFEDNVAKTGENLKRLLLLKLCVFGIDETLLSSKVVFVTDRGANIVAALRGYTRLNCNSHILKIILTSAFSDQVLEKTPELAELLTNANKLVKYFTHSGLQNRLDKSLKHSVETRWNSNYEMLASILSQYNTVSTILMDNGQYERITQINVDHLKTLVAFLKVFKDATNDLESDSSSTGASLVLPWFVTLLEHSRAAAQDPLLSEVAKVCVSGLEELSTTNASEQSLHMIYRIATLLTPKLRRLRMLNPNGREQVVTGAKELMKKMMFDTATDHGAPPGSPSPSPAKRPSRFTDWEDDAVITASKSMEEELGEYMNSRLPEGLNADSVLQWWHLSRERFPALSRLARFIFCVPASCAPSDRAFSVCGCILEERRTSLTPDNINHVLFLHSYLNK